MNRRDFVRSAAGGAAALAVGGGIGHAQAGQPTRKVLEGVEQIGWGKTSCLCYVGSVEAVLRYLGEPVTTEYVMGISGGAFVILWGMPWCDANCDIMFMGDAPLKPTFAALGYDYTRIPDYNPRKPEEAEGLYRERIVASIDDGRPVITQGLVGPPECSVVFGYDRDGEVLLGWSYFQPDQSKPFEVESWYKDCHGLVLVRDKPGEPTQRDVLKGALDWAIDLARIPSRGVLPGEAGAPRRLLLSGLAAYDAFAEALERDEDFPADNLEVLTSRLIPIANDGVFIMGCKRGAAGRFLTQAADWDVPAADELLQAADAYQAQADVWKQAGAGLPWSGAPEDQRRRMADPTYRRTLARLVREAKAHEERAIGHLETIGEALRG